MKLLKLGGSVITNKKGRCEANLQNIEKLAVMLGQLWEEGVRDIVLVHGAGSFGHALVIENDLDGDNTDKEQKVHEVQKACEQLSNIVISKLIENKVPARRVNTSDIVVLNNKEVESFSKEVVYDILDSKEMPVLHGDMVEDLQLGHSVISGDKIIALLAQDADFVVLGTDVDGIMIDDRLVERIDETNFEEIKRHLMGSSAPDVTGGMLGKVSKLKQVRGLFFIANAMYPKRIEKLLKKENVLCTKIEFKR
jgi:isopentenyl phosphate kinase